MSEVAAETIPAAEAPAVEATGSDDCSIKTEVPPAAPVEEKATETTTEEPIKEEEKADAFLQAILNFWAMITGKVKEIDESAGISKKVTELDGEFKVSESLINAKGVVEAKIAELTAKKEESAETKEEKEWVDVKEEKAEETEAEKEQ